MRPSDAERKDMISTDAIRKAAADAASAATKARPKSGRSAPGAIDTLAQTVTALAKSVGALCDHVDKLNSQLGQRRTRSPRSPFPE